MTQKNINLKRAYEKPSMKVYQLQNRQQLLADSMLVDPDLSPFQW